MVATDVGCCRELVYGNSGDECGQAGFVVPPMQREEIANAMERLCVDKELLKQMDIELIQGYYYGMPMPAEKFEKKFLHISKLQK